MPYKDEDRNRECCRHWYYAHLDHVREYCYKNREKRRLLAKKHYHEHAKESRDRGRLWRIRKRGEVLSILGGRCYFCGLEKALHLHKKDGLRHTNSMAYLLALKRPQEFVLLCISHHKAVHFCMKYLGFTWEKIVELSDAKKMEHPVSTP
jgi:hypothetical protein